MTSIKGVMTLQWRLQRVLMSINATVQMPRLCQRQTKRNNVPAQTPLTYYKRSVTIPFLDHVITEMATRFTQLQERASMGLQLVPSHLGGTHYGRADFAYYDDDLPSPASLDAELHQWQVMWMSKRDAPSSIQEALEKCDSTFFPNIKRILVISSTFPVTSYECERSISTPT